MMQDISLKGIGLLCHEPIEVGSTFVMKVSDREGQMIRIRCAIQRCERGGIGGVAFLLGATFEQVIEHKSLQLNEDEGVLPTWNDSQSESGSIAVEQYAEFANTGAAVGRAAVSFLKSLDPSSWLRKADDYSSIG